MQPCEVCGSTTVDAAGFCTTCRNYRGVPAQPVSGGTYPPADPYAAGYPTSAPSFGGQVSAPPVSGGGYGTTPGGYPPSQPFSAPPGYGPPMGYPVTGAPAGPPPKQRGGLVVPIIALCSVMALLVVGIVVVVLVRHGSGKGGTGGTGGNGAIDACLVGKWNVTQYTAQVPIDGVGNVAFVATDLNETVVINEDGTATDDYGTQSNPTVLAGTGGGSDYEIILYGTVTYTLHSANGVLSFSESKANGTLEIKIDGTVAGSEDLSVTDDPTPYTCSSTTFTQRTSDFTASASKVSG